MASRICSCSHREISRSLPLVLEALGEGKFSLSAQGIDKPITIMANEKFEVRANGKQLVLLRKSRDYDPSEHARLWRCRHA